MEEFNKIYNTIQKELANVSDIDIDAILKTAENTEYLENKTIHSIRKERENAVIDLNLPEKSLNTFLTKLEKYIYITKICDIQRGKYARWIKKKLDDSDEYDPKLSFGGVICDIKFNDTGTYILCHSFGKYYFSLKFDNFSFFQKISDEEWNILTIYTYCKAENRT